MSSNNDRKGYEGSGPGLEERDDKFQKSNGAYAEHVEETSQQVGAAPGLQNSPDHDRHQDWDVRSKDFGSKQSTSDGSGPTLQGSENGMLQRSDTENRAHVNNTSRIVGAGPGLRNSFSSHDTQEQRHPPVDGHGHPLMDAPTYRTNGTQQEYDKQKSPGELAHESTLSTIRTALGLPDETTIIDDHHVHNHLTWSSIRYILREPFAEFFGTFIMVLFGNASVAQVLLSTGTTSAPGGDGFGSYQSISWGWGIGVMLGIYVAGDSGGFLNPAVTFGFCFYRKLPWRRFPIYFVAQFLGGFVASAVVYANYINAINDFEGGAALRTVPPSETASAGIFCTYPAAFLTKASQFFSEFIASTILMFVIFALKDDSNPGAMGKSGAGQLFPLALLFLIFALGACFGWETGYAINLARDFGPRLMSYILGYGHEVWSAGGYYFWIPMVAPFCGCFFGGFLYDVFIYTGPESPVNTPWLGAKHLLTMRHWRDDKAKEREKEGVDKMV